MPAERWPGDPGEDTHVLDPMVEALEDANNGDDPVLRGPPSRSVLEHLKARRAELAAAQTLDIDVPGTRGLLGLRLGVLPRAKIAAMQRRAINPGDSPEADLNNTADSIIAATQDVLCRERRGDPFEPINADGPTRIDDRLAALFDLPEATRAREVLLAVCGFAPSPDLALTMIFGQYLSWAAAMNDEVDEEFTGE